MRPELTIIERIEKYLTNQLTVIEKAAFEKELENNPNLKAQVEAQKEIMEATKRVGLKKTTQKSHRKFKTKQSLVKGAIGVVVTTAIVALGIYLFNNDKANDVSPNYNTEFTTKDSISNFSNTQLEKEIYQIATNQDTIIETKDGVVLYIPENTFNTSSKTVDLVIQTAIQPEDILLAGLSTTSNGNPLETGGMFYVDAFANGNRVELNKALTIDVPTNNKKANMQLYKGEKTKEGEINWIAPKPLETFLTPVDILTLDFYPPNYEDSLDSWNTYDKAFKDSLYYSFVPEKYYDTLFPVSESDNLEIDPVITYQSHGEYLFKTNCASCHRVDQNTTGPMLKGARKRWRDAGEANLIYEYIHNPMSLLESGKSKRALEVSNYSVVGKTPQVISNYEIDEILDYADGNLMPNCVNPSTVKTIWDAKFNNTILATKEFEERMPFIHNSCSNEVLEVYINNLDKSLSAIDSLVLPLVSGSIKAQFVQFSQRGDGKVELTSKAAKRLAGYYARKQKMIAKAIAETQENYWKKQGELDSKIIKKENESQVRNIENTGAIFKKEFEKNLCKVYSEVNYPYDCKYRPIRPKYTVEVTDLGWHNIDREVYEATATRTSATINYNGKSSTLTYNEWSASVKNESQFNRVFVYNIPVEFSSYIKLSKKDNEYHYKLNADINYNTVVIGWTEDGVYYAKENSKKGHSVFNLKQIEKKRLKQLLKKELGNNANSKAEADFIYYAQKDQKRQIKNQEKIDLKNKIQPIIFPCWVVSEVPAIPIYDSIGVTY